MSEYTPTTGEVAESYVHDRYFLMDTFRSQEEAQDAFDHWLDQVRREAKEEALREAADELELPGSRATGYYASESDAGYREAEIDAEQWLHRRADQLEQEGQNDD